MQESVILDFVTFKLEVTGFYTPEEKMVMYYKDGSGHPGSPSEFEIEKVELVEGDFTDFIDFVDGREWNIIKKIREKPETWNVDTIWGYLTEITIQKIEENEYL